MVHPNVPAPFYEFELLNQTTDGKNDTDLFLHFYVRESCICTFHISGVASSLLIGTLPQLQVLRETCYRKFLRLARMVLLNRHLLHVYRCVKECGACLAFPGVSRHRLQTPQSVVIILRVHNHANCLSRDFNHASWSLFLPKGTTQTQDPRNASAGASC